MSLQYLFLPGPLQLRPALVRFLLWQTDQWEDPAGRWLAVTWANWRLIRVNTFPSWGEGYKPGKGSLLICGTSWGTLWSTLRYLAHVLDPEWTKLLADILRTTGWYQTLSCPVAGPQVPEATDSTDQ